MKIDGLLMTFESTGKVVDQSYALVIVDDAIAITKADLPPIIGPPDLTDEEIRELARFMIVKWKSVLQSC